MNTVAITDIVLIAGISIGIFISSVLLFIKKQNAKANKILAFILLLAVIMLLGRMFFLRFFENVFLFRIGTTVDGTVFLFGPLVLYFFKVLLFNDLKRVSLKLWHFIPFLGYLCFAIYTYTFTIDTYYEMVISNTFRRAYFFIEILGILTNIFFVYQSYLIIQKYTLKTQKKLSFNQSVTKFGYWFIIVYAFNIILWTIGFVINYIFGVYSKIFNYDTVWISIPICIYIVGFYALTQPEIFKLSFEKTNPKKPSRLNNDEIELLKIQLETILKEEKLYQKNDLSLSDLAEAVKRSNNDISWLLNNVYKTSFYEYINRFRVEEFIKRIHQGHLDRHTISAISLDVGFNSKSTFYKAFKLSTNTTPNNYIKTQAINS